MRYDWFCRDLNKGCAKEGGRVSQSKLDKSIRSANIASAHNGPQSIQIWLCPILEIPLSRCSISEENLRCLAIVFFSFPLGGKPLRNHSMAVTTRMQFGESAKMRFGQFRAEKGEALFWQSSRLKHSAWIGENWCWRNTDFGQIQN